MPRDFEMVRQEQSSISRWLEEHADAMMKLHPLNEHDALIIGMLVQIYCAADFNVRASIDAIDIIEGKPRRSADSQLFDEGARNHYRSRIRGYFEEREELRASAAIEWLNRYAEMRHVFCHWSGKRFPEADALVFTTLNRREGSRRINTCDEHHRKWHASYTMPELVECVATLRSCANDLGDLHSSLCAANAAALAGR
jgi:hypothetical protein